jgi:dihydrofolate reductase
LPRVNIIVARSRNGVIGKQNRIPWRLPEELAHFKRTTMGHPIVMGRKTWESLGRALPGRRNVVVSRNPQHAADGAEVVDSLASALARCADAAEVFVIGGAALYAEALPLADRLIVTEIDAEFDGDVYFPPLDHHAWRETSRLHHAPTESRAFAYDIVTLERTVD